MFGFSSNLHVGGSILWGRGFSCSNGTHGPMGAQWEGPIAFLIDGIPLGAPQGVYVNSGER